MDSHAYSQMWFVPWGYTGTLPVHHEEQLRVARLGQDALTAVHGTQFDLGTGFATIYPTSGTADDWSYGVAGIVHSACTETRDTGRYGENALKSHLTSWFLCTCTSAFARQVDPAVISAVLHTVLETTLAVTLAHAHASTPKTYKELSAMEPQHTQVTLHHMT